MNARIEMTKHWKRSLFDDDCKTVEAYAKRVAKRLRMAFGDETDGTVEGVYRAMQKRGMVR